MVPVVPKNPEEIPRLRLFVLVAAVSSLMCACAGSSTRSFRVELLRTSSASVSFGDVAVGDSAPQTFTVTNIASGDVQISSVSVTGTVFPITSPSFPVTLASGSSTSVVVEFSPTSTGSASESVSMTGERVGAVGPSQTLTIQLTGNGINLLLGLSPTSVSFGDVLVGSSSTRSVMISNPSTAIAKISEANVSGPGFSISGITVPVDLGAGQTTSFNAIFSPQSEGSASGTVSLVGNASNSPTDLSMSGQGVVAAHAVDLEWDASTSAVVGYNVYRGTQSGGPYPLKLNATVIVGLSFTDTAVASGQTFFYVARSVDGDGVESVDSNEATALIP